MENLRKYLSVVVGQTLLFFVLTLVFTIAGGARRAAAQDAMPSGWVFPTGSSNFGGYLGFLGYNSPTYPWHLAQDMATGNVHGASIYSIGDGQVILESTTLSGYGYNYGPGGAMVVRYQAADGTWFTALYGHLANMVPNGSTVTTGQKIGVTNGFEPPHVHFGIHPGYAPEPNNPWRGYTSDKSNTYGFVDPIPFLNAHPRVNAVPGQPILISPVHEATFSQNNYDGHPTLTATIGDGPAPTSITFDVYYDLPDGSLGYVGNQTEPVINGRASARLTLDPNYYGSYWWTAHGNLNGVSGPDQYWKFRFHINHAPDTPTLGSPADSSWVRSRTFKLSWGVSNDPVPGPAGVDYHVSIRNAANTWSNDTGANGYQGNSINVAVPADGDYYWRVSAGDGLDASPDSPERRIRVDSTPPIGFIDTLYQDGLTMIGAQTLSGWALDATSGVAQIQLLLDGQSMGAVSYPIKRDDGNPGFSMNYDFSTVAPGAHTVTLHVIDNAGNVYDLKRAIVVKSPVTAPAFSATASASSASVPAGAMTTVTAIPTNTGGTFVGLVDIEIYDATGRQIAQKFWDNQTLTGTQSYSFPMAAPATPGTYTLKVGIFNPGWAGNVYWNDNAGTLTVTAGDSTAPSFVATASASPANIAPSGTTNVQIIVTDTGGRSTNLIDVEIYDAAGRQVAQKFWDNQTFAAGSAQSFTLPWTAPALAGTYTVKVGVFKPGWSSNVYWNDAATTITVK